MEILSNHIYKSPKYSRDIKVLSVMDNGNFYTLSIYWIEPDLDFDEMDQIEVSKEDFKQWKLVN